MSQNRSNEVYTTDLMIAGTTYRTAADTQPVRHRGFGAIFSDCGNPRVALNQEVEVQESVQSATGETAAAASTTKELSGIGYTAMGNQYKGLIGVVIPERVLDFERKAGGRTSDTILQVWGDRRNLPFKTVQDSEFGPPGSTQFVYHCELGPLVFGQAMRGNKKESMLKAARIALNTLIEKELIIPSEAT